MKAVMSKTFRKLCQNQETRKQLRGLLQNGSAIINGVKYTIVERNYHEEK